VACRGVLPPQRESVTQNDRRSVRTPETYAGRREANPLLTDNLLGFTRFTACDGCRSICSCSTHRSLCHGGPQRTVHYCQM
jgi:hypothetical protein